MPLNTGAVFREALVATIPRLQAGAVFREALVQTPVFATLSATGHGVFNTQSIPYAQTTKIDMYVVTGSPGDIKTSKFDMYVAVGPPGPPPRPPRVIARMAIFKKPGT